MIRAVLPAHIRMRWDRIAKQQLAEAALHLHEENERLAREIRIADDCADMWQRTAEIQSDHGTVGLTVDGAVVALDCSPGFSIDDDPEYRMTEVAL